MGNQRIRGEGAAVGRGVPCPGPGIADIRGEVHVRAGAVLEVADAVAVIVLARGLVAVVDLHSAWEELQDCGHMPHVIRPAERGIVGGEVGERVEPRRAGARSEIPAVLLKVVLIGLSAGALRVEGEIDHGVEAACGGVALAVIRIRPHAPVLAGHEEAVLPCSRRILLRRGPASPLRESLGGVLLEKLPGGLGNMLCRVTAEAVDAELLNPGREPVCLELGD